MSAAADLGRAEAHLSAALAASGAARLGHASHALAAVAAAAEGGGDPAPVPDEVAAAVAVNLVAVMHVAAAEAGAAGNPDLISMGFGAALGLLNGIDRSTGVLWTNWPAVTRDQIDLTRATACDLGALWRRRLIAERGGALARWIEIRRAEAATPPGAPLN